MNEFKIGDWVVDSVNKLFKIDESILNMISINEVWGKSLKLWKPKQGEWCWFWDENSKSLMKSPLIGRYGELSWTLEYYDFCEPFCGSLPSLVRD